MRIILFILLISSIFNSVQAQDNQVWMVGPMIHLNFGSEKTRVSYGIEVAYWNYEHFPYSFDGGLEFQKQKIRLYTEAQTGVALAGVSLGPVVEFQTDENKLKAGIQGSLWGNYFLGFDIRFRHIKETYFCPGTYFKVPIVPGGGSSSSHSSHHHHHYSWD